MADPVSTVIALASALGAFEAISSQILKFIRAREDEGESADLEPQRAIQVRAELNDRVVILKDGIIVNEITTEDLERLDEDSLKLIEALKQSIQSQYDTWVTLYPQRHQSPDPVVNTRVKSQLTEVARRMCMDFEALQNYLEQIEKNLEESFTHIEFICRELTSNSELS